MATIVITPINAFFVAWFLATLLAPFPATPLANVLILLGLWVEQFIQSVGFVRGLFLSNKALGTFFPFSFFFGPFGLWVKQTVEKGPFVRVLYLRNQSLRRRGAPFTFAFFGRSAWGSNKLSNRGFPLGRSAWGTKRLVTSEPSLSGPFSCDVYEWTEDWAKRNMKRTAHRKTFIWNSENMIHSNNDKSTRKVCRTSLKQSYSTPTHHLVLLHTQGLSGIPTRKYNWK